jgi:hypothetical protein
MADIHPSVNGGNSRSMWVQIHAFLTFAREVRCCEVSCVDAYMWIPPHALAMATFPHTDSLAFKEALITTTHTQSQRAHHNLRIERKRRDISWVIVVVVVVVFGASNLGLSSLTLIRAHLVLLSLSSLGVLLSVGISQAWLLPNSSSFSSQGCLILSVCLSVGLCFHFSFLQSSLFCLASCSLNCG